MTIKIKVGSAAGDEKPKGEPIKHKFIARKSVDGHVIISDHDEIDIVVMPSEKKIVLFPKKSFQDSVYDVQNRLFHFLSSKGTIKRESVRSGNVYGSLEAEIPESTTPEIDSVQVATFTIGKFLDEEVPHMEMERYISDEQEERVTDPSDEESTELGEVPHKEKKGTLPSEPSDHYLIHRYYSRFA